MSQMEYNKGKLTEVTWQDIFEMYPDATIEELAYETNDEYECINSKLYKVEFEIHRGDLGELARANVNSDGSIDFETYHYNGGAHWTEVVEQALTNKEK